MDFTIEDLLTTAKENRSSDLHISVGIPPKMRIHGELQTMPYPRLSAEDTVELLKPILDVRTQKILDEKGEVHSTGLINLYNPAHISAILCNYSKLKEDSWSSFASDAKWLLVDFENLVDAALKEKYPLYYDLVIYKIDGKQNIEIQELLYEKHGIKHSVEYISSLWRNKIPKLIAEKAANDWLIWHFTIEEKGKWKRCSRCGQIKLAHNHFFSINKTSKDGFYSICKECRNSKNK